MNRKRRVTLTELAVVVALLVLLIALGIPQLNRSVKGIACRSNLKDFAAATRLWEADNNDKLPWQVSVTNGGAMEAVASGNVAMVFEVMSNCLVKPSHVYCPADKRRVVATTFANLANSNVSYFIGIDGKEDSPYMLALGDDHLAVDGVPVRPGILPLWTNSQVTWTRERHRNQGNVGLMDGSALNYNDTELAKLLRSTGVTTNRLALP
jgi:hypothetical protein